MHKCGSVSHLLLFMYYHTRHRHDTKDVGNGSFSPLVIALATSLCLAPTNNCLLDSWFRCQKPASMTPGVLGVGPARTVEFDFDMGADTAMSVASEMVEDLSLSHDDARAIAAAIKQEIKQLTGQAPMFSVDRSVPPVFPDLAAVMYCTRWLAVELRVPKHHMRLCRLRLHSHIKSSLHVVTTPVMDAQTEAASQQYHSGFVLISTLPPQIKTVIPLYRCM